MAKKITIVVNEVPTPKQNRERIILQQHSELKYFFYPEKEVHPSQHADILEKALKNYDNIHIETYSEVIILRLRYLVAAGQLDASAVDLIVHGNKIKIEQDGEISAWPTGLFSEAYREVVKLRQLQREQERSKKVEPNIER
jgi:predicted ATPase